MLIGLFKSVSACTQLESKYQKQHNKMSVNEESENRQSKDQPTMGDTHRTSLLTTYAIDDKPNC